jgi:hypothetical protein
MYVPSAGICLPVPAASADAPTSVQRDDAEQPAQEQDSLDEEI